MILKQIAHHPKQYNKRSLIDLNHVESTPKQKASYGLLKGNENNHNNMSLNYYLDKSFDDNRNYIGIINKKDPVYTNQMGTTYR